ncbi:transposable element Tcb1 transposase [Trichonephila clavipes]|nr:transposable element Tcb1 transposase [Trichonephila clavipes]
MNSRALDTKGWSEWMPWECSVSCGGGKGTRSRICFDPDLCKGPEEESGPCNTQHCPIRQEEETSKILEDIQNHLLSLHQNFQCTTSHEDRQIVRLAVTDRPVTSRIVAQHIESISHHSVSARTIRRRLQQSVLSARRPLLGLLLTQNHRRLRRQWCDVRRTWVAEWNEVVFTDKSRICLQHHDGRIRVWRHRGERMLNSCVMHHHTGPAPGIMV